VTICARAGSKGLPGKNVKLFNGKPLICWTIERALDWGVGPVIISSDDKKVEEIFGEYMGGDIYFDERPPELARDDTPKMEVLRHIVKKAKHFNTLQVSYVVDLDPTNPCRAVADLEKCRRIFKDNELKTLISVTNAKKNPFMNQLGIINGFFAPPCQLPHIITRRQDAPVVWDVNSSIYFYDTDWLLNEAGVSPISDKHFICTMPDYAFCDIDNEVDFEVAEFLHRKYYLHAKCGKCNEYGTVETVESTGTAYMPYCDCAFGQHQKSKSDPRDMFARN
jgi:CMP-N-acetylneuraminic acid synthetase